MGGRISACFRNRRPRAPLAPPPPRAAACSPTRPAIRRVRQVRVGGSADARRSRRPRAGSVRWRAALPDGRPRPGGVRPPRAAVACAASGICRLRTGTPYGGLLVLSSAGSSVREPGRASGKPGWRTAPTSPPAQAPAALPSDPAPARRAGPDAFPYGLDRPRMPPSTLSAAALVLRGWAPAGQGPAAPGGVLRGAREMAHGPLAVSIAGPAAVMPRPPVRAAPEAIPFGCRGITMRDRGPVGHASRVHVRGGKVVTACGWGL